MIVPVRGTLQFDGDGNAGGGTARDTEEQPEADAVAGSEDDRVSHHPGEQPQRTVLAAQQIVSQVQGAQYVQKNSGDAEGRHQAMVHRTIIEGKV